ncbi:MAG TPA: CocE/NonD family hydrolase C-terminal non-catalytic domain-containing protein, partial [Candidatus Dormibacteraeota bacterium]|nr:CocE/NonD family hydrolase C-terminal non-catalytic domain-containing protein [Candidatus Dormibacteraeota bacterium]
NEWPLARTRWTRYYLDADRLSLSPSPPEAAAQVTYAGLGDGVTFSTPPLERETEITGPAAAKLWIASSTPDADLFLVLRVFDPRGEEVVFQGSNDPHTPIAQGWLRASHRKLDPARTLPYRPYHAHDEVQPLIPGETYELEVEIWPTSIVIPPGYRLALSVRGKDYEYGGAIDEETRNLGYRGCGPFVHEDPDDRPPEVFGGPVTLLGGGERASYLLLPVIPAR